MTPASCAQTPRFAAYRVAVGTIGPLDFALTAGECLALSAPSGAGKTRLLRALADLEAHTGECTLDGRAQSDFEAPAWRTRVAFLAAESAWWADTAGAHIRRNEAVTTERLERLALTADLLDRPLSRISSGQRQRLAVVRLLGNRPDVLLLDEPTANLDVDNITRVEALIHDYCNEHDACCVWAGHDTAQLARMAQTRRTLDASGKILSCS